MKIKFKDLLIKSTILSVPGFISIFISLISIPLHLNYAGQENYGNYIIFHFILMISLNLNFGIGKSVVISLNNFTNKKKEITYEAIQYTKKISYIIFIIVLLTYFFEKVFKFSFLSLYTYSLHLIIGTVITVFYVTFEGIFQGNRRFKSLSIFNLFFFSISISVPSILLFFNNNLTLENLISISVSIKFITALIMLIIIKKNNFYIISKSKILINNLAKNSKWITLNGILIQFYDIFDKYLIKFFLGPIALATYTIPQQLTGKLSIISKSFSTYLLPDLSKKHVDGQNLNIALNFFCKFFAILIFMILPFYPIILKIWLGDAYSDNIHHLTKIFSLSAIFSCLSHILITKFEASKKLNKNLKFEFYLLPIFLSILFFLIIKNYPLLQIAYLILFKEMILFFIKLNFLKLEIIDYKKYYFYSLYFALILFLSFYNMNFYYIALSILIIIFLKNDAKRYI